MSKYDHFDWVNFSERHSEEVMFLLMLGVLSTTMATLLNSQSKSWIHGSNSFVFLYTILLRNQSMLQSLQVNIVISYKNSKDNIYGYFYTMEPRS